MNVIITGARRGIGRAAVEKFAQKQCNIWACSSGQNSDFEQDMAAMAEEYQVWIRPVYFDLSDEQSTKAGIRQILQEKLPIDVLVNCAGVASGGLMTMTPLSKLREVMEINFISQIHVTQLVAKAMMRQKCGAIVNIGSIGGIEAREGYLSYGSSKAALLWATRCISKELGAYGIRVNAVAPGLVDTNMGYYKSDDERQSLVDLSTMKRMGTPEEIADAIYFLASDEASFITGTTLCVEGGRII